jgi:threonine/homoserine/homoserine lactone efflux protein
MNSQLVELIVIALGIAAFPLPIMAVILALSSGRPKMTGSAFLAGWLVGLLIVGTIAIILIEPYYENDGGKSGLISVYLRGALGLMLVFLAFRKWHLSRRNGTETRQPEWIRSISGDKPKNAMTAGFLLSGANPKNILLIVAASSIIAGSEMAFAVQWLTLAAFSIIASLGVLLPIGGRFLAPKKSEKFLKNTGEFLKRNNGKIIIALLLGIGIMLIGESATVLMRFE